MDNGKLTIGYLAEASFENFQVQMLEGVIKAAKEKDVNLLFFAMEHEQRDKTYKYQLEYIFNILKRVHLDGLMFLGWSLNVVKNEGSFLQEIQSINRMPVVSLGRKIADVPSVFIDGRRHITEILAHLHDYHGYNNIAFVQPITPDERYSCYEEYMRERGLFKPELVVKSDEIFLEKDYYTFNRAKKVVELLIDERKAPVEAVISMYTHEAAFIMDGITQRGFRVPEDIAIVSWEDGDRAKYADSPITAVYFPFFEIGYEGCKKIINLIEGVNTPIETIVPAKLYIRNSCGCVAMEVLKALPGRMEEKKNYSVDEMIKKFWKLKNDGLQVLSGVKLLELLKEDEDECLRFLEDYISKILDQNDLYIHVIAMNLIHDIEREILQFYQFVLTNTADEALRIKSERMVFKVLILIQQKTEHILGYNEALKRGTSDIIQDSSQNIVTAYNLRNLNRILSENLLKINVSNYLLFFNRFSTDDIKLKAEGVTYNSTNDRTRMLEKLPRNFNRILFFDKKSHIYFFHILHIKNKLVGFIFLEPNQTDERIYYTLSIQLSSSIYGSMTLEKLKSARDVISENLDIIRKKTKELEESNIKLAQLDNLKNDFIANVTHDFRNPLTVIMNLTDLSLKYPDELDKNTMMERLNTIYNASVSLKHSIDQLLDIARIDAKGMKVHVRKIPLCSYIEGIIDFYRSAASSYGIRIVKELPGKEIDDFFSDIDKLDEIFHNIISNAIKFVEPETGLINITVKELEKSIKVIIEDNGIGIPPEKLELIFGRFEQVDTGRKGRNKGTGIGLFFARQLAILLKADLWAESEGIGKGSRFILELKRGQDVFDAKDSLVIFENEMELLPSDNKAYYKQMVQDNIEAMTGQKSFHASITNPNLENEFDPLKACILLVDDNIQFHDILQAYLANWGYNNFVHAYDGDDGLEAIYEYKPDLIICDYNMPRMRGDELQDRLIHNPEYNHIPIIFLSAIADKNLIMKGKEKGAIVYLHKPIDEKDLMVNVEYFLIKQMEFKKLIQKSSIDELTGLYNKNNIMQFLKDYLMMRSLRKVSAIMMDIDNFKTFNDRFGHLTGDSVVVNVGKTIRNTIRNYDKAGRFGGDEFLIILPDTSLEDALVVSEKIRKSINDLKLKYGDTGIAISASFGAASLIDNGSFLCSALKISGLREIFEVDDKKNTDWDRINGIKNTMAELLIEMADKALYRAKSTVCRDCGFESVNQDKFGKGICPVCRGENLEIGRNKISPFSDREGWALPA